MVLADDCWRRGRLSVPPLSCDGAGPTEPGTPAPVLHLLLLSVIAEGWEDGAEYKTRRERAVCGCWSEKGGWEM